MSNEVLTKVGNKAEWATSGGGGAQADLSQTDTTKPDYVKGVIRQESLPEGYPYKESVDKQVFALNTSDIGGNHDFGVDGYIMVMFSEDEYPITNEIFTPAAESFPVGTICKVTWDDDVYLCKIKERAEHVWYLGNLAKTGIPDAEDTGEPFLLDWGEAGLNCYIPGKYISGGHYEYGLHNFTVTMPVPSVVPMSAEFLPSLTSPNGTKYKLTVSDDGTLSAVVVS